jgi:hypothetical protein
MRSPCNWGGGYKINPSTYEVTDEASKNFIGFGLSSQKTLRLDSEYYYQKKNSSMFKSI